MLFKFVWRWRNVLKILNAIITKWHYLDTESEITVGHNLYMNCLNYSFWRSFISFNKILHPLYIYDKFL